MLLTNDEKKQIETEVDLKANSEGSQDDRKINSSKVYRLIVNECLPKGVRMKEDTPRNPPDKIFPILDTKMTVVDGHHPSPLCLTDGPYRGNSREISHE